MDTVSVSEADYAACLRDLAQVNDVTFAARPTLRFLARAAAGRTHLSVLDVACGHGDMLRRIRAWGERRGLSLTLTGVDLEARTASIAAAATPPEMRIAYRTSDVFAYVPDPPADVIVSSLFTHHLPDSRVVAFLRWMEAQAAVGWLVNDLHRHPVAYHGFRALSTAARWHRFVRHDGPVSIARAFVPADWRRHLADAGIDAQVQWWLPFRLCVSRLK